MNEEVSNGVDSATHDDLRDTARELRRGTLRLARRLRLERPRQGVSQLKLGVLAHLSREGPMSAGELAAAEHIQPQSLSRALAGLEKAGMITREVDTDDRRRSMLELTLHGRGVLHADMHQRDLWLADAMGRLLTPAERQLLALAGELMQKLAEAGPEDP